MEIKTYRASSMHEALSLVRRELGPDAAVLHTREVRSSRWFGLIPGARQIEVTASAGVNVPSRLPGRADIEPGVAHPPSTVAAAALPPLRQASPARQAVPTTGISLEVQGQLSDLQGMVRELCRRSHGQTVHDLPESLFRLFTDLIEADLSEEMARELVERVRPEVSGAELADPVLIMARIARMIEAEIPVAGPIVVSPGRRRLVALVGPTGVGKTTTIAKLAANYRLKEKRNVGLITVDTYRIAAVEQLRTYADIIDLPMQVVSTPREMRDAVRRLDGLDLVLLDTAGRSPRDDIKIQELKAFLNEAGADEVHLVLSSVAGSRTLQQTAQRFAVVGTTALLLTKLDEATGLGNLLPLLRESRLPVSYLTDGQNVPDDIETADAARLARLILDMESVSES
ncbi:MAG: flagellar biosynthesis protein FlhF [Planctomycetes bacterium RBG_16_64_12]|nr:MAG: flagellar biosynthesis protein FlhF [Planctomycetes bacterium RBG_16_64_12]